MNRLKAIFAAALALVFAGSVFAQTAQTRTSLYTEINTDFADNTAGAITPLLLRTVVDDMIASAYNPLADGSPVAANANNTFTGNNSFQAITVTTLNGLSLTAGSTGFTIAGGTTSKTLTLSNTVTLAGTDGSTLNIGSGGTLGSNAFTSTAYLPTSILPSTAPAAGTIPVGNSGGTAYAATAISGDSTLTSAGVMRNTGLNGTSLSGLATGVLVNTTSTGVPFILGYSGGSLTYSSGNLLLSGDSASPGNTMVYGTNGSGTKGWYAASGGADGVGFRNRIINGDFNVFQRNAQSSVTVGTTATYIEDRWKAVCGTSTASYTAQSQSSTVPAGYQNAMKLTVVTSHAPSSTDLNYILTNIEAQNIQDFKLGTASAATVTISFQAYASVTGTYTGFLWNSAQNRSYVFTFSIGTANTWTAETATITLDTSGTWVTTGINLGLTVGFDLGSGSSFNATAGSWTGSKLTNTSSSVAFVNNSSAVFCFTGVQLEIGSSATAFERLPITTETQLCQRYFAKSFRPGTKPAQNVTVGTGEIQDPSNVGASATFRFLTVYFQVVMRAGGTLTTYNPANTNAYPRDEQANADCGAFTESASNENGFAGYCTSSSSTAVGNYIGMHWTNDADF